MKSRVINTKHLIKTPDGDYQGLTSKLKPSLFYGNPETEGIVWLQDQASNKMSKWNLTNQKQVDGKIVWVYTVDKKYVSKFPTLEGKTFTVTFDVWQESRFAKRKRAGVVKVKGWKKKNKEGAQNSYELWI